MGKLRWYKRDPNAALAGMMELSLEERGAYNTVLDLIYARDGDLLDDERFIAGWLRVDVRVWRRIRTRLVGLGKLYSKDDRLHNRRADEEVLSGLSRVASAAHAGSSQRRKSGHVSSEPNGLAQTECERNLELTTSTSTKTPTSDVETPLTPTETCRSAPAPNGASPIRYAWEGSVVRLNQRDYDRLRKSNSEIAAFDAKVLSIDAYLGSGDASPKNVKGWFGFLTSQLYAENKAILETRHNAANPPKVSRGQLDWAIGDPRWGNGL